MLVLLDSNILISALVSPDSPPGKIVDAWLEGSFCLLTCPHQIDEIRVASRNQKLSRRVARHIFGALMNHLYDADPWSKPIPRKHLATDPTDSFLLDLIEAAQPDYAVTGDKRSGLLQIGKLGRTKILSATEFCSSVLHL
jgi:putative PIN family toxin of toxin-antitoxin system